MVHDHKVLDALDAAKTQWYHFTAVIIAGMGFFTDAYDLFSISLVTKLLGRIYYFNPTSKTPGSLPPNVSAAVNGVAFCGTLAGQLFFGWLGDKMGRKKVYGMTLMLMVICCLASGLSFGSSPKGVMATICFFRFWLGFGIGGDYPLSVDARRVHRGRLRHAGLRQPYRRHRRHRHLRRVQGALRRAGVQGRPRRLHRAGGGLRVVRRPHVRRHPGAAHLLLAHEDAGDGAIHRAGRQERQQGDVRHGPGAQRRRAHRGAEEGRGGGARVPPRGVWPLLPAVRQAARLAPAGHDGVLVHAGHRLLLAEPVPEGHLRRRELAAQGRDHERPRGDVQDLPRPDARGAVRHHPGLLVHRLLHRHRRPLRHPARRLHLHDGVHARPRHPVPPLDDDREPRRLRRHVRLHLLRQLRAQLHHLHHAGRDLPNTAKVHLPRHFVSSKQVWRHCWVIQFLCAAQSTNPAKTEAGYPPGISTRNPLFMLAGCNVIRLLFTFLVPESRGKSLEELSSENDDEAALGQSFQQTVPTNFSE